MRGITFPIKYYADVSCLFWSALSHKWSICRLSCQFVYSDKQLLFPHLFPACLKYSPSCFHNCSASPPIISDGAAVLYVELTVRSKCCAASSSARSAAPLFFTGSDSGYQADPSQLPEDMVHTGRYRCFPDWLHPAVCGNDEQTVEAAKSNVIRGSQTVTPEEHRV